MFLKQSTASQEVVIGPFLDEDDGKTAETGLTISNTDIRLSKAGANIVAKNSGGGTHDELGFYQITLDATDTNTVGELLIAVHESGALPVFKYCYVLEEAIYDSLFAASAAAFDANQRVDVAQIEGSDATDQINAACDAAIETYGLDHLVSASVAGSDIVDNSIVAKLVSKESTADWDDFVNTTDSLQALRDRGDASWTTGGGSAPTAAAIADAVWDEATSGHTSSGTFGEQVKTDIDAILVDTAEIGSAGAGLTALWTTDIVEAYAGPTETACTPAQLLYMIFSCVGSYAVSGNKITTYDLPGSGTMAQAMRFDMDDATSPTYRKRDA